MRSFTNPDKEGTTISKTKVKDCNPVVIWKEKQVLLTIKSMNFSFIAEEDISAILGLFAKHHLKINLLQTAAISFAAAVDHIPEKVNPVIEALKENFEVRYNTDLSLLTIRNYSDKVKSELSSGRKILLKQQSRRTVQYLLD